MKTTSLACLIAVWVSFGSAPWARAQEAGTPVPADVIIADVTYFPVDASYAPVRASFSADYLLWWLSRRPLPDSLVTTGDVVTGDPRTSSGPLGNPGTRSLFGGSDNAGAFSGVRLTAEFWLDETAANSLGLQVSGFLLEQRSSRFNADSGPDGSPILARPFFDVLNNVQSEALIAFPGAFAGGIAVTSSTRLWGAEANVVSRGLDDGNMILKWLAGFRYVDLHERLSFEQSTTLLPGGVAALNGLLLNPGDRLVLGDSFRTRNQFYGAQVGMQAEWLGDLLLLGCTAKLAMGVNHEMVNISGNSTLFEPNGLADSATGGILALRTNSGRQTQDRFAVIPELALKAGVRLTDRLTAFTGYSVLYCSDVVRPGDQVNQNINVSHAPNSVFFNQLNNPALPDPLFRHSDLWVHGVNFGFEFKF